MLPLLADQLRRGEVTREHVDVAVRCLDRVPRAPDRGRRTTGTGGAAASPVSPEQLGATVRDVVVDLRVRGGRVRDRPRPRPGVPAGARPASTRTGGDRFDPAAYERRFLDMSTDVTGMLLGRFQLDAAAGLALRAAVDALSAPAPTEDGRA